jgi:CBS domain-containing protein
MAARGFSRVPIYQKTLDNVRGILNAKVLVRAAAGQPIGRPLNELLHEPLFVPRTTPVKRLFLTFKQKKVHIAIVVSEYGKVLGLVTMDDLLAQIFGVLRDERADLQQSVLPGRVRPFPAGTAAPGSDSGPVASVGAASAPGIDLGLTEPAAADAAGSADDGDGDGDGDGDRAGDAVLDPPPALATGVTGLRPFHDRDEVTPPAIDIAELARQHEQGDDRS